MTRGTTKGPQGFSVKPSGRPWKFQWVGYFAGRREEGAAGNPKAAASSTRLRISRRRFLTSLLRCPVPLERDRAEARRHPRRRSYSTNRRAADRGARNERDRRPSAR